MRLFVVLLTVACHSMCQTHNNTKANPIVHFISIFTCCTCKRTPHTAETRRKRPYPAAQRGLAYARELMWVHRRRRCCLPLHLFPQCSNGITLEKKSCLFQLCRRLQRHHPKVACWWEGRFYEETASGTKHVCVGVEGGGGWGLRYAFRQRHHSLEGLSDASHCFLFPARLRGVFRVQIKRRRSHDESLTGD